MNIGVIGLGSIGERHVRNIQARYPEAAIEILTKRSAWDDAGARTKLIASETAFFKTNHDMYFITNETVHHADTIIRCLKQKPKGIFVEKPLVVGVRDLARIKKLTKNTKVFFVAYCLQFYKPILMMKEVLASGEIGSPLSMRVSVGSDVRTWRKGDFRKRYSAHASRGGGAVLDLIHELNYPAWLLKTPLHFLAGISARVSLPIKAEDMSEGIFRAGKTIVSIHQDFLRIPARRSCEIVGSKGSLIWEGSTLHVQTATRSHTIDVTEDRNVMYANELAFFMQKVHSGRTYSNFTEAAQDTLNAAHLKHHAVKK